MARRSFGLGLAAGVAAAALVSGLSVQIAQAQWKPDKPITIIVPWAAGGSTDQVTRLAAVEIEKALNQKVVIVNQGGASGSIGTKNAMSAPRDGYTWTAGAAKDIGTYVVSGLLDTKISDWRLYLERHQRVGARGQPAAALQVGERSHRGDEGQARPDLRGNGRRQLVRPRGHRSVHARPRPTVQARDLRRRQSGRDRGGVRRSGSHHAARGGAGQHDPRQAAQRARGALRPSAGARRLRHGAADHQGRPELQAGCQLLRHLRAEGRAGSGACRTRPHLDRR